MPTSPADPLGPRANAPAAEGVTPMQRVADSPTPGSHVAALHAPGGDVAAADAAQRAQVEHGMGERTPDERPPALLTVRDIAAGYGAAPIVSGVSLEVGPGEIVAIIGPNGAGKSTLLKALVGVIRALQGRVTLAGADITNLRSDQLARRGIGYVPQANDVFDALSVAENLEMGGYLLPRAAVAARRDEVLAVFPALRAMLPRSAQKLSGGERKMLAIARVLMLRPRVLVLDEPTANLSPQLSALLLRDHVRRLAADGTAVLLVEQRATAALEISDWAYVLVAGAVHLAGPAAELLARQDIGEVFLGRVADS